MVDEPRFIASVKYLQLASVSEVFYLRYSLRIEYHTTEIFYANRIAAFYLFKRLEARRDVPQKWARRVEGTASLAASPYTAD